MGSQEFADSIRVTALEMVTKSGSSHIASALSIADIVAVLYADVMSIRPSDPDWPMRDRFILSKGHACSIVYAALAEAGFYDPAELSSYAMPGSKFLAHISHRVPGVEFSTGSLGHGLPFGVGKAFAAQKAGHDWHTFVILGDGEMAEGSNWEAILFASHHSLSNITAVIDANNLQSLSTVENTLSLEPLVDKLRAFGANVTELDGHDHDALLTVLNRNKSSSAVHSGPNVVVARTTKGKGVSFMENSVAWHYKNPDLEQLAIAKNEIGIQ